VTDYQLNSYNHHRPPPTWIVQHRYVQDWVIDHSLLLDCVYQTTYLSICDSKLNLLGVPPIAKNAPVLLTTELSNNCRTLYKCTRTYLLNFQWCAVFM